MVCIFCRSSNHSKSNCSDRRIIQIQCLHILNINELIDSACNLRTERIIFENQLKTLLNKITVIQLKMIIEYYKKLVPIIHNQSSLSTKKNMVPIIVIYVKTYNYDRLHLNLTNWDHIEQVPNVPVRRNPPRARRLADQAPNVPVRRNPPRARRLADQAPNVPVRRNPPREIHAHTRYQEAHTTTYKVYKFDETCDENEICPICYEYLQIKSFVKLNCSHIFCKSCIILCNTLNITKCAICRIDITKIYTQNPIVNYSI